MGCGSPVVKESDYGRHVMSLSPVPLKSGRVGQRCTLNLLRAETTSCWCGVVEEGVPAQLSYGRQAELNIIHQERSLQATDSSITGDPRKSFLAKENGTWRRSTFKLYQSDKESDIVNYIKIPRIKWAGHVVRMDEDRTTKKVFNFQPIGTRRRGMTNTRWIDDLEISFWF
ncbi:uncharacterized protein TNCV_1658831 [Trichonephila clavipes]|nr:uncharacterized protein TNCV_1658831 [Trichonephila clavipes]